MDERATRAHALAARRRQAAYDEFVHRLDGRTRKGEWVVENPHRRPFVPTMHGVVDLGPTEITSREGGGRVQILTHSLLLVWQRWHQTLLRDAPAQLYLAAALSVDDPLTCVFELLPPTVIWNRPQPLLEAQPWVDALRNRGPLGYRRTALDGMLAQYELSGQDGRVLAVETRRYAKPQGPGQRHPIMEWRIELRDNPLPDLWLLAILQTTTRSRLADPH